MMMKIYLKRKGKFAKFVKIDHMIVRVSRWRVTLHIYELDTECPIVIINSPNNFGE